MAETDSDKAHMQVDDADTRDATQRLRFKSELDAARMMTNSRFMKHRKRSAATIDQQKKTRRKKQRDEKEKMSSKMTMELVMAKDKHKAEVTKLNRSKMST